MIGLGSNRLTVCRRGGMSVTQAGRGGMEWLAGGRSPLWASPYSAQATAALKAQFPTQWPTIRDYGFRHPEIVGYMNAYAPEDAKIAYSLVPTLNVIRSIKGDGQAYINTGYNPSSETVVDTMIKYNGWIGNYDKQFGDVYGNIYIYSQMNSNGGAIRWVFGPNSTTYGYEAAAQDGKFHTIVLQRKSIVYDGTLHTFADCGTFQMTAPMYILANNTQSSRLQKSASYIAYFKMTTGGVKQREMYPFIRKINGVDTCGMIDVLSGTFYQNAGSGSFTISETPAS